MQLSTKKMDCGINLNELIILKTCKHNRTCNKTLMSIKRIIYSKMACNCLCKQCLCTQMYNDKAPEIQVQII